MKHLFLWMVAAGLLLISACTKDHIKPVIEGSHSGYPDDIAAIVDAKCSIAGCHNTQSKDGAAGLDMSTWDKMMEGDRGGAVVIPFYHNQSTVFMFTNTYHDLGTMVEPSMPYNLPPLSRDEVIRIRDWIDNGAPNKAGFVKFSDNPARSKIYITNQGCDLVAVVDAASKLIMRYIPVGGLQTQIESPHRVSVSPDGSFWCVSFIGGTVLQKFSTANDALLGQADIGSGSWNTFAISHDGTKAYCADFSGGNVVAVDLVDFTKVVIATLSNPHGTALSADGKFLYATAQFGNFIYKIDLTNYDVNQISLDGNPPSTTSALDVHEIIFTPDSSRYFLTCQKSNQVRVMNAANDSLLAVIPVGVFPQEMAISTSTSNLFVTCSEDNVTFPGQTGSVYVIDYNNLNVVKSIYPGWQPHGVAVDEQHNAVYVANRNATTGGPAPHHTSECVGRNGYMTLIDLNTLESVPGFKSELSVDPYSAAFRP
jgi:YVTN family beta-propeller protein